MRRVLLVFVFVLSSFVAQAQSPGEFEPDVCPIPVPPFARVECGWLAVPERHENPDGPLIYLAIAIIRSDSLLKRPDPVIYLEGGPGGSALSSLSDWLDLLITRDRDLILFDQRGTGYSDPGLFCDAYEYDFDVEEADFLTYEQACRDALTADAIDLSAYNSAQSAQDVAMLARALGYEQVNLYGISYGTRLALTVMRDVPGLARAVVLDSPYPPHVDGFEEQAVNGFNAIDALLTACGQDPACSAAFPNLGERFYQFLEDGGTTTVDLGDGEEELTGYDIVSDLFDVLYDSAAIPHVPLALDRMTDGDGTLFGDLINGEYTDGSDDAEAGRLDAFYTLADDLAMAWLDIEDFDDFLEHMLTISTEDLYDAYDRAFFNADEADFFDLFRLHLGMDSAEQAERYLDGLDDDTYGELYVGMLDTLIAAYYDFSDADAVFNSVHCVEEVPFNDVLAAELLSARVPEVVRDGLLGGVYDQFDSCEIWGVTPAGALETELVRSDIPTLVLAGEFDPVTPPVWGEAALEGLSSGQLVVIPGGGHSLIDAGECPASLGVAFLDNPTAPLDTACVDALRVRWVTEN